MTLIAVYNSEGRVGRCDARCYNAKTDVCDCCCGGMNHGTGRKKASENTEAYAERILRDWQDRHAELRMEFRPIQKELFG